MAGVAAALTGENFSIDVALAEGANTVLVEAFDTVGHRGTATVEVTRQSAAPSIRIEVPAEGLVTVTAASVSFDPEIVLPTQTSAATVVYTLASEAPSGLPLTLVIREELELLDGTLRRSAPYRADLVLYGALDGTPRSRFRLQPSVAARTLPIRLGAEDVTVLPYADESVRGNVLGPEGGTVVGDAGDRLAVAAGALTAPTAVTLTRRTVADLPLAAPAGGTVDGSSRSTSAAAIWRCPAP